MPIPVLHESLPEPLKGYLTVIVDEFLDSRQRVDGVRETVSITSSEVIGGASVALPSGVLDAPFQGGR